jgi:hypothetical protein
MHPINSRLVTFLTLSLAGTACGPLGEIQGDEPPESMDAETAMMAAALTGNGAPSGSHFTLNLIGVDKSKSTSLTGNNGSRIFVPLAGKTNILLSEGPFQVLDANATDGSGAFQLPNPDPDNDGTTTYSVFARALGKPGGTSKTTTCATDSTGETWCSVYSAVATRTGGKQTFQNVSRELLYVYADLNGDGTVERYNLFNDALQNYYWQYDNTGLKLLQLRFYEVPTTVPAN